MRIALPALAFAALALACTSAPAPAPDDSANDPSSDDGSKSSTTAPPSSPNAPPAPPGTSPPGTPPAPPGARPDISSFPGSHVYNPTTLPAPGILMLHGSEGGAAGYIDDYAKDLAKRGFVVVTMCWFGCTGKPDKILRIPLESVIELGNWLATSPDVNAGKVGLFGWSRGAEMSLLVSAVSNTTPFKAVAVHAPSDTVVGAFDPAQENTPPNYGGIGETDPKTGKTIPSPSWTPARCT
jgi:predicted alpha/beta-fold hydrolase